MAGKKYRSTLGDYFTLQRGTTYKSRLLDQPGPVLLGLATIQRNGGFRSDSLRTYGGESPDKLLVQPGELYVSLKDVTQSGDLLGAVARIPFDYSVGRLTQDTVKLEPIGNDVPIDYLYWLLRTPQYRSYCRAYASGTTNLGLAREDFLAFPAPEPTEAQHTITRLVGSLDDKIELNRRMNETLEALARALFKSWFVDFDTVRAKMEGRQPVGMDDETAALFPNSFEDSALGEIPKGWMVEPLDQIAYFLNGLALQKYPPEGEESLPAIKITELRKGVTESSGRASTEIPSQYIVEDGDVLFSWSGSLEVQLWAGGRGALNQHLFKVTSNQYPKWFYYYWIKQHLTEFRAIAADKATTMGHIKRHHLTDTLVVVPPETTLRAMSAMMEPIVNKMLNNTLEASNLAAIPDALLPKLLSGELRVGEAEEIVEEAL